MYPIFMHDLLLKITELPFWACVTCLFFLVGFRTQVIYWFARLSSSAAEYGTRNRKGIAGKINKILRSAQVQKGVDAIDRWGLVIIPLSFATWGFQTIVHLASGVMRIPWGIYTLVSLPGYLLWAYIYSTIGLVVVKVVVSASSGSYLAMGLLTGIVGIICCVFLYLRYKRKHAAKTSNGLERVP